MNIPEDVMKLARDATQSFLGMAPCYPEQFQLQDAFARAILTDREARTGWRDIASAPVEGGFLAANATEVWAAWHFNSANWHARYGSRGATHWQPLPAAPSPSLRETEGEKEDAAEDEKPIAHLVWLQGRRGPDDVEDYYEVARPGDKCVDGSDPFPVFARPYALLLEAEKALESIVRSCTSSPTPMSDGDTRIVSAPSRDALVAATSILKKLHTITNIRGRG